MNMVIYVYIYSHVYVPYILYIKSCYMLIWFESLYTVMVYIPQESISRLALVCLTEAHLDNQHTFDFFAWTMWFLCACARSKSTFRSNWVVTMCEWTGCYCIWWKSVQPWQRHNFLVLPPAAWAPPVMTTPCTPSWLLGLRVLSDSTSCVISQICWWWQVTHAKTVCVSNLPWWRSVFRWIRRGVTLHGTLI